LLNAALVLVGVLLPWVTARTHVLAGNSLVSTVSYTGLDFNQGHFSIAASIIGAIAALVANKKPLSLKWLSLLILSAGVVIIGVTLNAIGGGIGSDIITQALRVNHNLEVGVFITLLGGCLLFLGGLASLLRKKKAIKKV